MKFWGLSRLVLAVAALVAAPVPVVWAGPAGSYESKIAESKSAMMSDPATALAKARSAAQLSVDLSATEKALADATVGWLSAEALNRLGKSEEAAPIAAAALTSVVQAQPGSKLHADLLKTSAAISAKMGEVQKALPTLHSAFSMYQKLGETRSQAIILQNIGSLYQDARDYQRSLDYYEQAAAIYKADPAVTVALFNNRGNALKEMGKFSEAEAQYRAAMQIADTMDSPFLKVNVLSNIAAAQLKQGQLERASATVNQGLRLDQGTNSEWRAFLNGTAAQIAFKRGDVQRAAQLIEQTFSNVDIAASDMAYRDHHEVASVIYSAMGRNDLAFRHLQAFKRLDDKGRDLAASTNDALLSARFDVANQQLRISKQEAQLVQRDLKLQQTQNQIKNFGLVIVLGGGGAAAIIISMMFAFATSRRRRQEISEANVRLTHAANHDQLTGLPNRAFYRELAREALEGAIGDNSRCALMLVDLDRFKWVNDTHGHHAGDELLRVVANCLNEVGGDFAHAVRLGGDEFALVVPKAGSDDELIAFGDKVVERLSQPHDLDGTTVNVGATIGVAVGPVDGADLTSLTRSADLALYEGKGAGRGCTVRYRPDMRAEIEERRALEEDLRYALERGEIQIAYQAILGVATQQLIGYEALLRWDHPTRGLIPPSKFIPIAEEAGLINRIGDWVLRTACNEAASWPEHVGVSVNLSVMQVEGNGLVSGIMSALAASGLAAERLELEVTESVFLGKDKKADETLAQIRALGVRLALDDFGTGFSSLGYLRRATFSTIKIDRSFVKSASNKSEDSVAIIRSIVLLAEQLGMRSTAEGVETLEELELVRSLGCDQVQGYLFSRPTLNPLADIETTYTQAKNAA